MFLFLMLAVPPFSENVPVFDVGGATLHHKDSFRYLGMVFYRTLNMAKSAEHAARPFLASAHRIYT
jgi:hypothetical protein